MEYSKVNKKIQYLNNSLEVIQYRSARKGGENCSAVIEVGMNGLVNSYYIEIPQNRISTREELYGIAKKLTELEKDLRSNWDKNVVSKESAYRYSVDEIFENVSNWNLTEKTIGDLKYYLFEKPDCPSFIKNNIYVSGGKIKMREIELTVPRRKKLREWKNDF